MSAQSTTFELLSPVSLGALALVGALLIVGFALLRLLSGPPAAISRRRALYVIRALVMLTLLAMLANPVRVEETPGPVERPDVFYLIDSSQSMAMGNELSRWEEALQTIRQANESVRGITSANISVFLFGQRLMAVESLEQLGIAQTVRRGSPDPAETANRRSQGTGNTAGNGDLRSQDLVRSETGHSKIGPTDADTQMVAALRQISSRFGRSPPSSIVLFSDGRARDAADVEKTARHFKRLGVPIHVLPVGDMAKGGDVAIVSAVLPARVRKHSRVEVQVFLRSFGYNGRRSQLKLWALSDDGTPPRELASLPITLTSGVQSRSLTFRSDLRTQRLRISIEPQPDEIVANNNEFTTEIGIERTKIRVLYVEGNSRQVFRVQRGPYSDLHEALTKDPDIECVIVAAYGSSRFRRTSRFAASLGFPETVAELSAFDAIMLSNVPQSAFTDEQLDWIEHWISHRGAGLCMVGGPNSFAAGAWDTGVLAKMLPVEMQSQKNDWNPGKVTLQAKRSSSLHPIWHIVDDEKRNQKIVGLLPAISGANRFLRAKPNLTTVIARTISSGGGFLAKLAGRKNQTLPAIVVGRYGKGRTVAMATPITTPSAASFVNNWGDGDNRYYVKFWQNVVYWLTENSTVGRRRLLAAADKRFYRPGDTINLRCQAYDEGANLTTDYRIVTTIEPAASLTDLESDDSPIYWPNNLKRDVEFGGEGPYIAWGEEFELPRQSDTTGQDGYGLQLSLDDALEAGSANQSLRVEFTAYEDFTQVDSTSIDIQVIRDPFEQQNPFPDHELLKRVASVSGGQMLETPEALAAMIKDLPVMQGPPIVGTVPLWSQWWLLAFLLLLLTVEWLWRRSLGLA